MIWIITSHTGHGESSDVEPKYFVSEQHCINYLENVIGAENKDDHWTRFRGFLMGHIEMFDYYHIKKLEKANE